MSKKKGRKKKGPDQHARKAPEPGLEPSGPDTRAMEKPLADITRLLEEKDFETMEEANAFLDELLERAEGLPPSSPPATPLEKAQETAYKAFQATGKKRAQLARKALRTSEDCADAYVILAEETAKDPEEARKLYEQGVEAGERALGQETFEGGEGAFWDILETRPYMRAREGLALCLWELGERPEAIQHYVEMLRLNPNDNQGIRYLLVHCLFEEDLDEALKALLDRYEDDAAASWMYARALWRFRNEEATEEANTALKTALEANPYVPLYLLGQRRLPGILPELIQFGGESEAVSYVSEALTFWLRTPGALEWLRENAATDESGAVADPDADLWDLEEEDEEFIAALQAEEEGAVELLREALPELRDVEPPSDDIAAASRKLRDGFTSGEWPYEHMMLATGWETSGLPADDTELWLGAAGGLVSPREETGLELEEESYIIALELGAWLGAVIGLIREGVGASASPEALVSYINDCPEIDGLIDSEDASPVRTAFELVLPAWEAAGALDDRRRLTALGRWGLPRALAWAWNHDFDSGQPN